MSYYSYTRTENNITFNKLSQHSKKINNNNLQTILNYTNYNDLKLTPIIQLQMFIYIYLYRYYVYKIKNIKFS